MRERRYRLSEAEEAELARVRQDAFKPRANRRYHLSVTEERSLLEARAQRDRITQSRASSMQLDPELQVKADIEKINIKNELNDLKRKYKSSLEQLKKSEDLLSTAIVTNDAVDTGRVPFKVSSSKRKIEDSVALVVASDWHVMESIDPDTVCGLNEYNPTIARQRAQKFAEEVLDRFELVHSKYDTVNMTLCLLGDFISGYIHEELMENNHGSPIEEVIFAQELLINAISFILDNSDCIETVNVVCKGGNHGRTTQKEHVSAAYENSYETLLYHNVASYFAHEDRVTFLIEKGYLTYVDILDGFIIRVHHGHNISYQGGVGGLSIPVNKAIAKWNSNRHANLDVFGHFHTRKDDGAWLSNGSLPGYGAYAIKIKAQYEPPQQNFVLIRKNYGKDIVAPIYVS